MLLLIPQHQLPRKFQFDDLWARPNLMAKYYIYVCRHEREQYRIVRFFQSILGSKYVHEAILNTLWDRKNLIRKDLIVRSLVSSPILLSAEMKQFLKEAVGEKDVIDRIEKVAKSVREGKWGQLPELKINCHIGDSTLSCNSYSFLEQVPWVEAIASRRWVDKEMHLVEAEEVREEISLWIEQGCLPQMKPEKTLALWRAALANDMPRLLKRCQVELLQKELFPWLLEQISDFELGLFFEEQPSWLPKSEVTVWCGSFPSDLILMITKFPADPMPLKCLLERAWGLIIDDKNVASSFEKHFSTVTTPFSQLTLVELFNTELCDEKSSFWRLVLDSAKIILNMTHFDLIVPPKNMNLYVGRNAIPDNSTPWISLKSYELSFGGKRLIIDGDTLDFSSMPEITDDILVGCFITNRKKILHLTLENCRYLTDRSLEYLVDSHHNETLSTLKLDGCVQITDRGVMAVAASCHHLEGVYLFNCPKITKKSLEALLLNQKNLRALTLPLSIQVDEEELYAWSGISSFICFNQPLEIYLSDRFLNHFPELAQVFGKVKGLSHARLAAHIESVKVFNALAIQFKVNDLVIHALSKHSELEHFCADVSEVSPPSLQHFLQSCTSLKSLHLNGFQVTDSHLVAVGKLSSLNQLTLHGCYQLTSLPPLPSSLKVLDIKGSLSLFSSLKKPLSLVNLTCLNLDKSHTLEDEAFETLVSETRSLERVNLTLCGTLTDRSLKFLSSQPHLTFLSLGFCSQFTQAGLKFLEQRWEALQSLWLYYLPALDDPLLESILKGTPNLTCLDLDFATQLTGRSLQTLAKLCPKIEKLRLSGWRQPFNEELRGVRNLRTLALNGNQHLTLSVLLYVFQHNPQLEELFLSYTNTNDHVLRGLSQLSSLTNLHLSGCHEISDEGICAVIKSHPNLKTLNLKNCKKLTDRVLEAIAEYLPRIENLNVAECPLLTPHGFQKIGTTLHSLKVGHTFFERGEYPELRVFSLSDLPELKDEGFIEAIKSSHSLQAIKISRCKKLSDPSLIELSERHPHLTSLKLAGCSFSSKALLSAFSRWQNLQHLNLSQCPHVDDDLLALVARQGFALQEINLSGLRKITDQGVISIIKSSPLTSLNVSDTLITDLSLLAIIDSLKTLSIRNCPHLTPAVIKQVLLKCRYLKHLDMEGPISAADLTSLILESKQLTRLHLSSPFGNATHLPLLMENCPHLLSLDISHWSGITDAHIQLLVQKFKGLYFLGLKNIKLSEDTFSMLKFYNIKDTV